MKKILNLLTILFTVLMISSCDSLFGNDEDDMLEDYNSAFQTSTTTTTTEETTTEETTTDTTDSSFDEDDMLLDYYLVSSNSTLILTAPDAVSYKWTFIDDSDGTDITDDVVFMDGYHSWTQVIMIYIPESVALQSGKTYRLKLTITTQGGKTYTDVCGLVIYSLLNGGKY